MPDHVRYSFNPVGKGLFATGSITSGINKLSWIYDCGSSTCSTRHDFTNVINQSRKICEIDSKIDIVVISHFDEDHINGIQYLGDSGISEVKYIFLPYVPLLNRILSSKIGDDPAAMIDSNVTFVTDPLLYIKQIDLFSDSKVILIPYSSRVNDSVDTYVENGHTDVEDIFTVDSSPLNEIEEEEYKTSADGSADVMSQKSFFKFTDRWLFSFYNKIDQKFDDFYFNNKSIIDNAINMIKDNLRNINIIKTAICDIKKLYKQYAPSSAARNNTSLVMHVFESGTSHRALVVKRFNKYNCTTCLNYSHCPSLHRQRACSVTPHCYTHVCHICTSRTSILYTGDINIKDNNEMNLLVDYFGLQNSFLTTLQVMHHGSEKNCNDIFPSIVKPCFSVFCADESNHHPSGNVLRYFANYNPLIVNKVGVAFGFKC